MADNNRIEINVSTPTKRADANITKDLSQYYAGLSKSWAIKMNAPIEDGEYSAKFHATRAESASLTANTAAQTAEEAKNILLNNEGFQAVANDLTGNNTIGAVAENLDVIAQAATASNVAVQKAQEASESALKALTYAEQANISAINAESSASVSAGSATSALNNANIASNSAITATEQATIATNQANSATLKAEEANTSANNAQTYSESAQSALLNVQTSAESAANSATNAQNSANSATQSAQNAEYWAEQAATGQVNADWNETDPTSKAYILNKPIIPTETSSTWGEITGDIANQSDLQLELSEKQKLLTPNSPLEIKTVTVSAVNKMQEVSDTELRAQEQQSISFNATSGSESFTALSWNASYVEIPIGPQDLENGVVFMTSASGAITYAGNVIWGYNDGTNFYPIFTMYQQSSTSKQILLWIAKTLTTDTTVSCDLYYSNTSDYYSYSRSNYELQRISKEGDTYYLSMVENGNSQRATWINTTDTRLNQVNCARVYFTNQALSYNTAKAGLGRFIDTNPNGWNLSTVYSAISNGTAVNTIDFSSVTSTNLSLLLSSDASNGLKVREDGLYANSSTITGQTIFSLDPLIEDNLHLLDGSLLSVGGIYDSFITNYIASLHASHPQRFCTEEEWQTSVSTYGVCGKYVYTEGVSVRLPKVTGFVEGTLDANALGELVEAGLPNITGTVGTGENQIRTGAFYGLSNENGTTSTGGSSDPVAAFDASRSNSIYGNSNTVQPQAIKGYLYLVVGNVTQTEIEVDINNIATDLNNKADTDLSNAIPSESFQTTLAPDYANAVSITSGYTCTQNGYIFIPSYIVSNGGTMYLYINGQEMLFCHNLTGARTRFTGAAFRVGVGDVVSTTTSDDIHICFAPLKGGN